MGMQHEYDQATSWLHKRGITDKVIAAFSIHTADVPSLRLQEAIVIPVRNIDGTFSFNKYRRNPLEGNVKPKYLYDRGGKVTLYGADMLVADQSFAAIPLTTTPVIITEGELDTLVCWSQNIAAVSSTGGSLSFQEEWVELLSRYDTYICFDNDEAGMNGALKVHDLLPNSRIIIVPDALDVKDISDYVSRGGNVHGLLDTAFTVGDLESAEAEYRRLSNAWRMKEAKFFKLYIEHLKAKSALPTDTAGKAAPTSTSNDRLERAKSVDCRELITFKKKGRYPVAKCLWHDDSTPSLTYYERSNNTYCFSCGKYASSIDIVMARDRVDLKQAIKILLKEV